MRQFLFDLIEQDAPTRLTVGRQLHLRCRHEMRLAAYRTRKGLLQMQQSFFFQAVVLSLLISNMPAIMPSRLCNRADQ